MQTRWPSASVAMADSDYTINHVIRSLSLDVYGVIRYNSVTLPPDRPTMWLTARGLATTDRLKRRHPVQDTA